eukprot:TRINITY_DN4800_c0_g1_i3.p1 TRINITY_DN4800_c0_g1~~TRINITY_DN4800_c0_g1_i3.p1  ORF type:complete len:492 (+),score=32.98 TRINITY_DN4800_c0_g1_i3:11-1486(+)
MVTLFLLLCASAFTASADWASILGSADEPDTDFLTESLLIKSVESFNKQLRELQSQATNMKSTGRYEDTEITVPLSYEKEMNGSVAQQSNGTMVVHMTKYLLDSKPKTMLWLFAGLGESSTTIFRETLKLVAENFDIDVWSMDTRGVAGEDSLANEDVYMHETVSLAEILRVYQYMPNSMYRILPYISTDNNCRDIYHQLVAHLRVRPQEVLFLGLSTGTHLVHRFVQMYPDVVSRVLLDSTIAGPKAKLMDQSFWQLEWLYGVCALCAQNEYCHSKMGPQPVLGFWQALQKPACGNFDIRKNFRYIQQNVLTAPDTFQVSFAIIYRYLRCDPAYGDDLVLEAFSPFFDLLTVEYFTGRISDLDSVVANSFILFHMRGSEFSRQPVPSETEISQELNYTFANYYGTPSWYRYRNRHNCTYWPWNPPSLYENAYASSHFTKFLFVSGELDWLAPLFITEDVRNHIPESEWVIVPGGGTYSSAYLLVFHSLLL